MLDLETPGAEKHPRTEEALTRDEVRNVDRLEILDGMTRRDSVQPPPEADVKEAEDWQDLEMETGTDIQ